jgi:hypothetical protein
VDKCIVVPGGLWAGYSASPPEGTLIADVSANWTVPKVSCPINPLQRPRAAIWVGLWGHMDGTGWLPQIGTSSDCNDLSSLDTPVSYGATYHLAWQLYAQDGAGSPPQEVLKCNTGDHYYNVCARHYEPGSIGGTPVNTMRIAAGDHINAAVALLNVSASDATMRKPRSFEIRLTDLDTGDAVEGIVTTNEPVTLDQVDVEGGVIVESNPAIPLIKNGLAEFDTPIQVSGMTLLTSSPAATWHYNEWVMQRSYTDSQGQTTTSVLAKNSDYTGSAAQGIGFTVKWLSRY